MSAKKKPTRRTVDLDKLERDFVGAMEEEKKATKKKRFSEEEGTLDDFDPDFDPTGAEPKYEGS